MGVDAAARKWATLVHLQPGTLVATAREVNSPFGLEEHLRFILRSRSGCTTLDHAKRYALFHEWLKSSGTLIPRLSCTPVAVFFRYLIHLKDNAAKRTVLTKILLSLECSSAFLGLRTNWHTNENSLPC